MHQITTIIERNHNKKLKMTGEYYGRNLYASRSNEMDRSGFVGPHYLRQGVGHDEQYFNRNKSFFPTVPNTVGMLSRQTLYPSHAMYHSSETPVLNHTIIRNSNTPSDHTYNQSSPHWNSRAPITTGSGHVLQHENPTMWNPQSNNIHQAKNTLMSTGVHPPSYHDYIRFEQLSSFQSHQRNATLLLDENSYFEPEQTIKRTDSFPMTSTSNIQLIHSVGRSKRARHSTSPDENSRTASNSKVKTKQSGKSIVKPKQDLEMIAANVLCSFSKIDVENGVAQVSPDASTDDEISLKLDEDEKDKINREICNGVKRKRVTFIDTTSCERV